ncbi:MAG: hypothetical protein H0V18_11575 [Pyrinomonadaceae bacterium]|nr:hypothetical protein [Pyrinomonadaceae bacterium]
MAAVAAAQGIADAEARAKAEIERRESRIQAEIQKQEALATINREREERERREAEQKRKRDAEQLEAFCRQEFFDKAPAASETDWLRVKRSEIDKAMTEGRNPVSAAKERLLRSGRYSL